MPMKNVISYLLVLQLSIGALAQPGFSQSEADENNSRSKVNENLSERWKFPANAVKYTPLDEVVKNSPQLIVNVGSAAPNGVVTVTQLENISDEQIVQMLKNKDLQDNDVLLSTDSIETYDKVATALHENKINNAANDQIFKFIPVGRLASLKERITSSWKTYVNNAKETIQKDKLGLTVVTITTATDSLIWMHSTDLDIHQRSAMVLMNIILAAAFGLDRDLWVRMTTPLRHKIMNTFEKYASNFVKNKPIQATIATQFLANMTFTVGFQMLRRSIISVDSLYTVLLSTDFWAKSILIGGIMTLSSFAWGELHAAAKSDKNPIAKNTLKRFSDLRSIIMSQVAASGMVLQPNVYGYSPIVAILISGGLGVLALTRANKVINWLEVNKYAKKLYNKQMAMESMVNEAVNLNRYVDINHLQYKILNYSYTDVASVYRMSLPNKCSSLF